MLAGSLTREAQHPGGRWEPVIAAALEGAIILAIGAAGWALRQPLIFTSLGPTAYEMIEKPNQPSAQPYNVVVGHLVALAAGFAALALVGAWAAPVVSSAGYVPAARFFASGLAVAMTVAGNLLLKSSQPAALSTTLMVSLGSHQSGREALAIVAGVLLITALGEPVRRWRSKAA